MDALSVFLASAVSSVTGASAASSLTGALIFLSFVVFALAFIKAGASSATGAFSFGSSAVSSCVAYASATTGVSSFSLLL